MARPLLVDRSAQRVHSGRPTHLDRRRPRSGRDFAWQDGPRTGQARRSVKCIGRSLHAVHGGERHAGVALCLNPTHPIAQSRSATVRRSVDEVLRQVLYRLSFVGVVAALMAAPASSNTASPNATSTIQFTSIATLPKSFADPTVAVLQARNGSSTSSERTRRPLAGQQTSTDGRRLSVFVADQSRPAIAEAQSLRVCSDQLLTSSTSSTPRSTCGTQPPGLPKRGKAMAALTPSGSIRVRTLS